MGVTSYLSQSEVQVGWEEGGGEEKAIEARRNLTPTPHCSHCTACSPTQGKTHECPCKLEDKTPKRSILWTQSHLRIEVFVILNKMKTKRHVLNTRVDRTEFLMSSSKQHSLFEGS